MLFNLFKSKPTLKELIPDGFVDIHSHILPGIDDGAKNIEESLELISKMKEMGFSKIIGTPHTYAGLYENNNESIKKSFEKLNDEIQTNTNIGFASEYMLDNTIIEKAQNKKLLCLKDNYVLVEMSFISPPANLYELLFELKVNGYIPILAHPERYNFYHNNFDEYFKLKKVGCKFQLNLLSTTGYYGNQIARTSNKLLKRNLIDFSGSDIHRINHTNQFTKKVVIENFGLIKTVNTRNNLFI